MEKMLSDSAISNLNKSDSQITTALGFFTGVIKVRFVLVLGSKLNKQRRKIR